ncbi:hypothetical protein FB446DRAFT_351992 [Lentinula raphanica]|nr:hypothetical protein FB446DRAFT_351992 [Lentinula raphanica]
MLFLPSNCRRHGLSFGFVFPALLALVATMSTFASPLPVQVRPPSGAVTVSSHASVKVARVNFEPPAFSLPHFPVPETADRIPHAIHDSPRMRGVRLGFLWAISEVFKYSDPTLKPYNMDIVPLSLAPQYPQVFEVASQPSSRYMVGQASIGADASEMDLKGVLVATPTTVTLYYSLTKAGVEHHGSMSVEPPNEPFEEPKSPAGKPQRDFAKDFWVYVS